MGVHGDIVAAPHGIFDSTTCFIVELHKLAFIFVRLHGERSYLRIFDIGRIKCGA